MYLIKLAMASNEKPVADSTKRTYSSDEHSDKHSDERASHLERAGKEDVYDISAAAPGKLNAIFENPLADVPREKLLADVEAFCAKFNLMDHLEDFKKGALASQNPGKVQSMPELTDADKEAFMREKTHKWSQPWQLYWLVGTSPWPRLLRFGSSC